MRSISICIFCLFLMFSTEIFAQETKLIENKTGGKGSKAKEEYYVLVSNKNTKHGKYKKYDYRGAIEAEGYYKNNKRDSIWTEYSYKGKVKTQGFYTNDLKKGLWEYYDDNAKLEQKYNHTTRELVYFNNPNSGKPVEIFILQNNDTISIQADQSAMYIGGASSILEYYQNNISYPMQAVDNNKQGTVYIAVKIDANGKASAHKAISNLGFGLEEEALRVIKLLPEEWIPAMKDGKPIESILKLPVKYVLVN